MSRIQNKLAALERKRRADAGLLVVEQRVDGYYQRGKLLTDNEFMEMQVRAERIGQPILVLDNSTNNGGF